MSRKRPTCLQRVSIINEFRVALTGYSNCGTGSAGKHAMNPGAALLCLLQKTVEYFDAKNLLRLHHLHRLTLIRHDEKHRRQR
jgi:hypothetical protein